MTESATPPNLVMPKLGLTMSEGLLAEWLVEPGAEVTAGQTLFVVETDKISNEVEAPANGTILSILAEAGSTVPVGAPVATWTGPNQGDGDVGESGGEAVTTLSAPASEMAAPPIDTQTVRRRSTPLARRLALQNGVDLAQVTGSGPKGRIQARDIQLAAAADVRPAPVAAPPPAAAAEGRNLRRLIAARVLRSKAEIPHFHVDADATFDELSRLRQDLNANRLSPRKLSVTAFLAMAVARALALEPSANAVWRGDRPLPLGDVSIGIAVDTPDGVMAVVIPVQGDIYAFADAMDAAVDRARSGRLLASDIGPAAIGISNVGMMGVRALTPIIDPDQSFMLGVGSPRRVFRPDPAGNPVVAEEVSLSLACDHRVIDGAPASRFLATIVELIEKPLGLLLPR